MDLHRPTRRTYASISHRKARGRQKHRWGMTVGSAHVAGPEESYANAAHALRMAVRVTGFILTFADTTDPAYVKLYGHNPTYAILIQGWNVRQAAEVFGEQALEDAANPAEPGKPWPIVSPGDE